MISLIIPVYNEEEMLKTYDKDFFPVVDDLKNTLHETFEIVLVDDKSQDSSWNIINGFIEKRPGIIGVRHEKNRGMGGAINTGIVKSHGNLLVFLDADLTFKPQDIRILLEEYQRFSAECISGSPYLLPGLMDDVEPWRMFLSRCVNILYRLLLGTRITSVSPIFRLYKRGVFDEITVLSENFEINAEILSKMIFKGMTIREVPVALHERQFGESKAQLGKSVKNHIRILYKIFSVKYLGREWT
jgi:glycosyltransferase involved in cell wall biosynthesis